MKVAYKSSKWWFFGGFPKALLASAKSPGASTCDQVVSSGFKWFQGQCQVPGSSGIDFFWGDMQDAIHMTWWTWAIYGNLWILDNLGHLIYRLTPNDTHDPRFSQPGSLLASSCHPRDWSTCWIVWSACVSWCTCQVKPTGIQGIDGNPWPLETWNCQVKVVEGMRGWGYEGMRGYPWSWPREINKII